MIRRLMLLGALVYAGVLISKQSAKRANEQTDLAAQADWDSEGGTPAPEPVDTPIGLKLA